MRKLMLFVCATFLALSTVSSVEALTLTSLVGDMDSFGTGVTPGDPVRLNDFQRTPEDGDMDMEPANWHDQSIFSWQHNFGLSSASIITGAQLTIVTIGIQDAQPSGNFNTQLYLDGIEFLGAFDEVDNENWFGVFTPPHVSVFDFTTEFLPLLVDGSLDVMINSDGGLLHDCIAIDYAILEVEVIPEPNTMLLFTIGIISFVVFRKIRKK